MGQKLYTTILGIVLSTSAVAQDASVFDRIQGVKSSGIIRIKFEPIKKEFQYRIDEENRWIKMGENDIFNIKNNYKNHYILLYEFYNPLLSNVDSNVNDIDDPSYKALSDFLSHLPISNVAAAVDKGIASPAASALATNTGKNFDKTLLLNEWVYNFSGVYVGSASYAGNASKQGAYEELIKSINKISLVENFLYGKMDFAIEDVATKPKTLNEWLQYGKTEYRNAGDSYFLFNKAGKNAAVIKAQLVSSKDVASENLKNIITLLTIDYDSRIAPFVTDAKNKEFKNYTSSLATRLSFEIGEGLLKSDRIVNDYSSLVDKLTKFADSYKGRSCGGQEDICDMGYKEDYSFDIARANQKMKVFTYNIAKIDENGAVIANSKVSTKLTVGKRLSFYPFVTTSAIYTNFSYPNYAIASDNGINKIVESEKTEVNLRPAVFLNAILADWGTVYPFAQLGITSGVNDVLVPVGLGISIGNSFSISGGGMFGYAKKLNKLILGEVVKDDATLKADLTNKPAWGGYISINYNITKK